VKLEEQATCIAEDRPKFISSPKWRCRRLAILACRLRRFAIVVSWCCHIDTPTDLNSRVNLKTNRKFAGCGFASQQCRQRIWGCGDGGDKRNFDSGCGEFPLLRDLIKRGTLRNAKDKSRHVRARARKGRVATCTGMEGGCGSDCRLHRN